MDLSYPTVEAKINGRKETIDRKLNAIDKKTFYEEVFPELSKLCNNDNNIFLNHIDAVIDYISDGKAIGNVAFILQNPDEALEQIKPNFSSAAMVGSIAKENAYGFSKDYNELVDEGFYENGIKVLEGD